MTLVSKTVINWTPDVAYAIGLITTDGNLSKDGRHIIFVSKDLALVRLFKKLLGLGNKISTKTSGYSNGKGKYYFTQFGSVKFYDGLLAIGLRPNKSKNIAAVKIPNKHFADFLRGHLDGDGIVRTYNDPIFPTNQRLYLTFMSASKAHIYWLQNRIKKLYGIEGQARAVPQAWILVYAKKESKILVNKIYYNKRVPSLHRKRKLIENYL